MTKPTNVPTTGTAVLEVVEWHYTPTNQPVESPGLFDAVVIGANKLVLRPRTELAKSLLGMWLGGECRRVALLSGIEEVKKGYGSGITSFAFEFSSRPMLCSGDDPYHTGMQISDDEQKACRALVERLRKKARRSHV